jgi:hypothetical protein
MIAMNRQFIEEATRLATDLVENGWDAPNFERVIGLREYRARQKKQHPY